MHTSTLIKKANRLLIKKANELLKSHGITHAYTYFLMELYIEDGLTQTEIRKRVGIQQPTAVRTLDRMERDGFITRKQNSSDRRSISIKLTKKGKSCEKIIATCAKQLNETALNGFNNSECLTLINLIKRLNQNLNR